MVMTHRVIIKLEVVYMSRCNFSNDFDDMGSTPVSNFFINHYMLEAPGEYVKVYLLGLKYSYYNQSFSMEEMADKLFMSEDDIEKALKFWERSGVIKLRYSDNEYYIEYLPLVKKSDDVHTLSIDDTEVKQMFETVEKMIGRPLSPTEMNTYLSWVDEYGFSLEILTMLISYCVSKNKTSLKYMEKVAIAWHDAGLKTALDVEAYLKSESEKWLRYKKILRALGLKDDDVMEAHKAMMDRWMDDLGFDVDVIIKACDECVLKINEPSFPYINQILINWYNDGIRTVNDLDKTKKKPYTKKTAPNYKVPKNYFNGYSQRTYDVDELEKKLLAHSRGEFGE